MYWKEIQNCHFERKEDLSPEEGDMLAAVSIDAWKSDDDWEEGVVVARVMLSTHGDILVDYRDAIAMTDEAAQSAIEEAKLDLRAYYAEQTKDPSNNHKD